MHQPRLAQISLPSMSDADLTEPHMIAHATGHSPTPKAGGSQQEKQPASILTESILLRVKSK